MKAGATKCLCSLAEELCSDLGPVSSLLSFLYLTQPSKVQISNSFLALGEGLIPISESSSGASSAICSRCPWLGRDVEPDDLQNSFPTSSISLILSSCAAEQGVITRADMSPLPDCSPCLLLCQALPHR